MQNKSSFLSQKLDNEAEHVTNKVGIFVSPLIIFFLETKRYT